MNDAVTFIVKATDDKSSLGRCLKSIYRQSNKSFRVIVISSLKDLDDDFKKDFHGAKFVSIKKKRLFHETANKQIKQITSRYFMYVNSDSVLPVNAVEEILQHNEDTVIFNISKLDDNGKFKTVYPSKDKFTLSEYIKRGVSVWNNAICTEFVLKKKIFLESGAFFDQLMYLLQIFSGVKTLGIIPDVLVYRSELVKKKKVKYEQLINNRKLLKKILKGFTKKNMIEAKKQVIADFVFSNIDEYYDEKRWLCKLVKRHRLLKYIFI